MSVTNTKSIIIRAGVVGVAVAVGIFAACAEKGPPRPTCAGRERRRGRCTRPHAVHDGLDGRPTDRSVRDGAGSGARSARTAGKTTTFEIMTISDFEEAFAPAWFKYGEPGVSIDPLQAGEPITDAGVPIVGASPPQPWWGLQVATLSDAAGRRALRQQVCAAHAGWSLHIVGRRLRDAPFHRARRVHDPLLARRASVLLQGGGRATPAIDENGHRRAPQVHARRG